MEGLRISTAVLGVLIYFAGFIGNILSFLLFIQKELHKVSTGLIFLLLNIFSTIHLLSLIVEFLSSIFQFKVLPYDIFRCQFTLWLQNAARTVCSFLATTVAIDRFIRSEYPIQSRAWCTTRIVIKLFVIYCLFSMSLYAFFFHPLNVLDSNDHCSFSYDDTFRLIALNIMPPIRFILICVMPSILMIGCGGRMLYNIQQARKRIVQQRSLHHAPIATMTIPLSTQNKRNENRRQTGTIDRMLLLMVLLNVIAYIVTQIPFSIYTLYYGYEGLDNFTFYALMRAFLLVWSSAYFGIGFYLFCIASSQFRKQLLTKIKNLCICYCPL
ncbi:unnamed protein product [Rotaria sp. Silwood2]|nr:unnamed protein product [Rotaria sp. Silwood2]CAF2875232.1 unnamed protein product [Rotaria sp. Silwood2]CAF3159915.1 unnamed protein product [Rotaria sp. Silwood2]CAF3900840.1 unnamed protein product [Rotaria sp. Silwood2]CAF3908600.1 unnamed protein product [Rotaria sp. Silwood2]